MSYASSPENNRNESLYLLSGCRPSLKKARKPYSELSLLLWTALSNLLLITSLILAFQSRDIEFIKIACIILPIIAIAANILDYKSIMPTLNIWEKINGHCFAETPVESNTTKTVRYLPIVGIFSWGSVLFL